MRGLLLGTLVFVPLGLSFAEHEETPETTQAIRETICTCPQLPVLELPEGGYLYECEQHNLDAHGCSSPVITHLEGDENVVFPADCTETCGGGCIATTGGKPTRGTQGFPGLPRKIRWDQTVGQLLPDTPHARVSRVFERFVRVMDGNDVFFRAKLFLVEVEPIGRAGVPPRLVGIGYEVEDHPRAESGFWIPKSRVHALDAEDGVVYRVTLGAANFLVLRERR